HRAEISVLVPLDETTRIADRLGHRSNLVPPYPVR
ncbi:hypothetical protein D041_4240B, partial [Vibrio parahaemolyticus EKP-008]